MDARAVKDFITDWLKDYARRSNTKGFVVGVSGGIDSAVTSALGAATGLPTLCLEMPIYQYKDQVNRAKQHIEQLKERHGNVSSKEVELTPLYDAFTDVIPPEDNTNRSMALVNTRARLRMTTLYYFAGLNNYLVLGTGNKVEDFGVGFFTKYGDGGVDLSPIADLLKTEVYALGKEMDIDASIMQAAPTDGLWGDDRTDEDQIGATYPELEWAMQYDESLEQEVELTKRQKEVMAIYRRLNKANQHKMLPIPVCTIPEALKK